MHKKIFAPILVVLLLTIIAVGCAPAAEPEVSEAEESEVVKVFGAFATPIEEPWMVSSTQLWKRSPMKD